MRGVKGILNHIVTQTDEPMITLSIIIPAYNEEARLGPSLERIAEFLSHQTYKAEVLVCDDGSRDGTCELVDAFAKSHPSFRVSRAPHNQGKGAAVRRGMLEARGRYLLMSDADLSSPIEEVDRLMAQLEKGHDVAIGSRALESSDVKVVAKAKRKLMGRVFNALVQTFTGLPFQDTQCGFKLFERSAARHLFGLTKLDGFSFDVEVLFLALRCGYKVKEVAVNWAHVDASRVDLVNDTLRMAKDIMAVRALHRTTPRGRWEESQATVAS